MILSRTKPGLFYIIFFFSGVCGLGYQMVWSRLFALGLGHEMPAVLAIMAAFFGGLALGAWALDRPISRSARPGYWYGVLESIIGLWGLGLIVLLPRASQLTLQLIGLEVPAWRHWIIAFGIPFVILLPATAAMGATLPAMERFVAPLARDGRCVGALYAVNTLGAVTGTLASAFWITPAFGFSRTLVIFAALNLLGGVAVLFLARYQPAREAAVRPARVQPPSFPAWRLTLTVFCTGLLGIGYEALGVRLLAQVLENTVYSFSVALAVFLLGTSAGAGLYQRFGRRSEFRALLGGLLCALATACVLGVVALSQGQWIYDASRARLGDSQLGVLTAEMLVAAAVFGLPTLFMGATFSHLVQAARRADGGVGRASGFNTLGSALAPLVFGVLLLTAIGVKWALVVISLGYLLLLPQVAGWQWLGVALPIALVFVLPARVQLIQLPPGAKLREYRDGVMDSVAVVEHFDGHRNLRVNNRFNMGGTGSANAERRHAHIPLLLHPGPKRALFIGVGTGISFGAFGEHPGLQADGVELVPEILEMLPQFEPYNNQPQRHLQLKLHVADARRFVRVANARYDVIVADLFHPARDGAGALYTREHFQVIRERLAPGGLFCQWLPLFQLDEPMLRVIVRTFLEVFPHTQAYLLRWNVDTPVLGLVGTLEPMRYSTDWFEQRVREPKLLEQLKPLALTDGFQLLGCFVAGPSALRDFSREALLNTDDHPVVIFGAPRFSYQRQETAYGRLFALLDRQVADPRELILADAGGESFGRQLSDFIAARNVYLHGLAAETEGKLPQAIEAFLESARLSPNFSTGYAHCLTLAMQQSQSNPSAARVLLQRLIAAQPSRPIAAELLKRLAE